MSTSTRPIKFVTRVIVALICTLTIHAEPAGETRSKTTDPATGWLPEVSKQIADAEYAVTWQEATVVAGLDAAWQAPNRANGWRTYFTAAGIRVIPRGKAQPAWEWALALSDPAVSTVEPTDAVPAVSAVEPATAVSEAEPATIRVDGNRVEYQRGGIVESYVNDRRGLVQSFKLSARPSTSTRDAGFAALELALSGTLAPVIAEDGQAVDFTTPNGEKVVHAALAVQDSRGHDVYARLEGFSRDGLPGIRIAFDDRDAVFPVTVTLLASSAAWTTESDQDGAGLGISVATAGDVNGDGYSDVIVGAYLYDNGQADEGRAFVYHSSAAGLQEAAAWTAESNKLQARFGFAVATAGDINGDGYSDVIVGAPTYANGETREGCVFVYHGSPTGLQTNAAWTLESNQTGAELGNSVATAGDVNGDSYSDVIIGAHLYDDGSEPNQGRAIVYHGSAVGLGQLVGWAAQSGQAGAEFGASVATAGDVDGDGFSDVIVGANLYDHGDTNEGRAFVYHGSPTGVQLAPAWTGESNQADAHFGNCVATAGDVNGDGYSDVIVGSDQLTHDQEREGRAYVYLGSSAGVRITPAWTAEGNQDLAEFGHSVASAGDVNGDGYADVIVGAIGYDDGFVDEGRAVVYHGSATGLKSIAAWTAAIEQTAAYFGSSVATAGDVNGDGFSDVIVGAFQYDGGETDEGRASVYLGSPGGLQTTASWTAEGNQGGGDYGISVATAGDVNGDGFSDVIVGADFYDDGFVDEGRAFLYLGSAAGLTSSPAWTAEGKQADARLGSSVATAGDVNGDGYSDVIVGASWYDHGSTDEGRVFVYHGSAEGLHTVAAWTAESDQAGALFGGSVSTAGDVNGDGYSDVVIGAWAYDDGQSNEGRAYVFHGSANGLESAAAWTASGEQEAAVFGWSVATAGDVNGDGYSDVIVGAIFYDNGQRNEGRAFVYHGSPSGLQTREAWTAESDRIDVDYGYSVATAGDVNGDGYSDVIVGSRLYENGQRGQGRAFAYYGSATGLQQTASWTAEIGQANAWFGYSVASAGDVNGDGYSDVIVGAPSVDSGQIDEGRAFVYHGSVVGLLPPVAWTAESDQTGALFGTSVATAGDVNGDGYSDVVVGAIRYDSGETNEGRAFVYYGNGGPGPSLRPQQRRVDDLGPIAPLGASDSLNAFRLALRAVSPFGRARVRLEWEVKPFGVLLDGLGTEYAAASSDSGTDGAALSETVSGLAHATPYHWRVRMTYDATTTPFLPHSRWLRAPFGGWQEAMLRTGAAAAGRVSDGAAGDPLTVAKTPGFQITLSWGASCAATDTDYEIYEGTLGDFTSHVPRECGTSGATMTTITPFAGNSYYLIVPRNSAREGSYGTDSAGIERPVGRDVCLVRELAVCQ